MRRIDRHPWWVLVFMSATHVGCASLSGQTAATNNKPAAASSNEIQRASYIEQRYRDEFDPVEKPKASGLDAISPENLKRELKELTGQGAKPPLARQSFAEAEQLYAQAQAANGEQRQQLFIAAGAKYIEAAERWPNSLLEEDALFQAGESYFFADQYPKANEQYEKLVKQHPNTRHMDTVDAHRFAIAQYWLDLDKVSPQYFYTINFLDKRRPWRDTRGHAFRVFDKIRVDDPSGKLSDDATMAAANAYFASGDYFKADSLYTDLRKTFPSSEHQFAAHFLGLKTKLLCYDGPDYSGEVLDQAENLVKQIRRQFPQQAEAEKEYLSKAYAEIRFKKAERLWTRGRYHELRHEYRAAQFYFDQIAKDFSDTPFHDQAREHVTANQGKPPIPEPKFDWLVNLFPPRENAKPLISSSSPVTTTKR